MSTEVIGGDLDRGSHLLASYFDEWAASLGNKGLSKSNSRADSSLNSSTSFYVLHRAGSYNQS
jgi:hypothetical protein